MTKNLKSFVLAGIVAIGLMLGAVSVFGDGNPTPPCNPNSPTCLPPSAR